jgi:hypothetical protein
MQDFEKLGVFYLGRLYDVRKKTSLEDLLLYDSRDLVTHGVCIGMTGSGKTGLCISLLEEAALDGIPSIVIDPKGDITNLLLTFPELRAEDFAPWINEDDATKQGLSAQDYAVQQAQLWKGGLSKWGQDGARIRRLRDAADFVIYTPGSNAGLPVSILKSFSAPPPEIIEDNELLQERISTTVTSLLGLLGIEADPIQSREHILISTILATAWKQGVDLNLEKLIQQIQEPPVARVGVLDLESFYSSKERFTLAMRLNNLLAAPGFELWLQGESLDISTLLYTSAGKPKVSIFYIALLNDAQRMFFVSLLLNQIVGWMRTQSGTTSLRAIVYMDEVFGYLPPLANPPSKTPLLTLLKQARAFGVGVLLATQNPVDLDYKGLSNTGTWFIGRLQTDRDKMRVMDALETVSASSDTRFDRQTMDQIISSLGNRIFLMHNVHEDAPVVFETRWAMSYLRGPLTRNQIKPLMDPIRTAQLAPATAQSVTAPTQSVAALSEPCGTVGSQRPILSPEIPQYFLPMLGAKPDGVSLTYYPMILGAAQVRFADAKTGIDTTRDALFFSSVTDDPIPVNWDNSTEAKLKLDELRSAPSETAQFAELAPAASNVKNYDIWQKDFINWLLRTQKLELLRSPSLKELSKPGEAERDFRVRLQQAAREHRDQCAEKLRLKYASAFARLDQRIGSAQAALEKQKARESEQKYETAVSFGASLLGSFLGRKSARGAARAAGKIGRVMKESKYEATAQEKLKALQKQRAQLESQFQSETSLLEEKLNPLTENLESASIRPTKTNISTRLIALLWTPHWLDEQRKTTPAWQ